jgi:hypothetical protein
MLVEMVEKGVHLKKNFGHLGLVFP